VALIDPEAACIGAPEEMLAALTEYCRRTGQAAPEEPGEMARAVFSSLALDYRLGLGVLEAAAGQRFTELRLVGGGSANPLLCQLTADATGVPVLAGPVEATALGNVLLQARAAGALAGAEELAQVAAESFPPVSYESREVPEEDWARFLALKERSRDEGV
jgi:rhamnulokinase